MAGLDHRFPKDHLPKEYDARAEHLLLEFTRRSG